MIEKELKTKIFRKDIKMNVIKSKRQRKRIKLKRNNSCKKSLRMLGVNAAGIKSKITSFKNVLNELKPAVFFLEETKDYTKRLENNKYLIYICNIILWTLIARHPNMVQLMYTRKLYRLRLSKSALMET